ncbi:hypothetical protein CS390_10640 [Pseudomonas sp. HLS-6]|uniref:DUF2303 family protein n=1 Tax=Pseudomonas sp. HLS-6 TaxID=2049589 RepID=UPI000C1A4B7C|nr:DUF2303 family protein [Pseudomonas sp. HLS-6]ATR82973.1 hypothetical protein CS390_10640 [Pseudomonas sp. HLS-6]
MSLNKDTLELIIDNAAAARELPLTHVPVVALPDNVQVRSLEHLQLHRSRFRGMLNTNSLHDFADYVLAQSSETTARGFVDQDSMSCTVFFNLGDSNLPGHGDDLAKLALKPTAAYQALTAIAGKQLTQRELAEWMEDWHASLAAIQDTGTQLAIGAAVNAVRNITIKASSAANHSEHNFGASRSAMDSIEAASDDIRIDALHFTFAPYEGLGERTFTLKLSILTGGDKPALKLRWVGKEVQQEEIAQEFKAVLSQEVGSAATLTLGTFSVGK